MEMIGEMYAMTERLESTFEKIHSEMEKTAREQVVFSTDC